MSAPSDFPTRWCESHIDDMFWTAQEKVEHQRNEFGNAPFHQRLRALYMEKIPGIQDLLTEEIEAQLHYNANKHTKKSDPRGRYYPARERLYRARWAVAEAIGKYHFAKLVDLKEQLQLEICKERDARRPPSQEEVARARSLDRATFSEWLKDEIQLYTEFLAEPWRQKGFNMPGALSEAVGAERLQYLKQLHTLADREGMDAAFHHYVEEEGHTKLEVQYDATLVELDGETASGADGYYDYFAHSRRPQLYDPVKDAGQIASNKARYTPPPRRSKFDVAPWLEAGREKSVEPEQPKRPSGRPKGAKNKRKPRPVNPEVAAWQAEADKKYPHLKAS